VSGIRLGIQGSGQLVGELPAPSLFVDVARRAEELGYDSIWAGDHISFENPILDVTVALATFVAVTSRITVGAGIVLLPLRPPALVAKEFASLDYLSGGRVVLGIGVGGESAQDYEAVGVPVGERGARADDGMAALRALFAGAPASYAGRFSRFAGISIEPRPVQAGGPPLWVGGRSTAALRRAGTLGDGWLPIWISPERYEAGWSEIRRHAESAGRDPDAIVPAAVVPSLVADDGEQAREEVRIYLGERYGTEFSPQAVERYCVVGTPEECGARVEAYAAVGVQHLVFNPAVPVERLPEQVERLAGAVLAVAR
jgi:probable F420-dependent oxidoreductase